MMNCILYLLPTVVRFLGHSVVFLHVWYSVKKKRPTMWWPPSFVLQAIKGNQTILMALRELWPQRRLKSWAAGKDFHSSKHTGSFPGTNPFRRDTQCKAVAPNMDWAPEPQGLLFRIHVAQAPLMEFLIREVRAWVHAWDHTLAADRYPLVRKST